MTLREFAFSVFKSITVQASAIIVAIASWAYATDKRVFVVETDLNVIRLLQTENRQLTKDEIGSVDKKVDRVDHKVDRLDDKVDRVLFLLNKR